MEGALQLLPWGGVGFRWRNFPHFFSTLFVLSYHTSSLRDSFTRSEMSSLIHPHSTHTRTRTRAHTQPLQCHVAYTTVIFLFQSLSIWEIEAFSPKGGPESPWCVQIGLGRAVPQEPPKAPRANLRCKGQMQHSPPSAPLRLTDLLGKMYSLKTQASQCVSLSAVSSSKTRRCEF